MSELTGTRKRMLQRYVEWGYDFLKYDWCSYSKIGNTDNMQDLQKPYILMGDLLKKQNRDIILNLCQYGMGDVWKWGKQVGGQSWSTAGDLGGSFEGIAKSTFQRWLRCIQQGQPSSLCRSGRLE